MVDLIKNLQTSQNIFSGAGKPVETAGGGEASGALEDRAEVW